MKNNPAEELFAGTAPAEAVSAFGAAFVAQVGPLAASDVGLMTMAIPDAFNAFESISQPSGGPKVVFKRFASKELRRDLEAELTRRGSTLTTSNLLDRATSQTCAGCHQLSSNAELGEGLSFPPSLGFVHIDESRQLSPALKDVFLPARLRALERFIAQRELPPRDAEPESAPPN